MNYDDATKGYRDICDLQLADLRSELTEYAIRYAQFRVRWQLADAEHRADMNAERTRAHNAFIDSCNILARNMAARGEDASWRDSLGQDRKDIGDFACYIHLFIALAAR